MSINSTTAKLAVLTLAIFFTNREAMATIVSGMRTGGFGTGGGIFLELTPPIGNVGDDNHQSDNLFAFNEDQNITLTAPLTANIGLTPLPIGTEVASHYIFFDPDGVKQMIGFVIFDSAVLSIMTQTAELAASDFLANVSATYLNPTLRGLEAGDFITIDGSNPNRVNINLTANSPGDYIRVLTVSSPAVPEPNTLFLLVSGLLGLAIYRRRRQV